MSNPQQFVQKLWNYCIIIRDDGLSHGTYVEQLTLLLFLKMAYEQAKPPINPPTPAGLRRADIVSTIAEQPQIGAGVERRFSIVQRLKAVVATNLGRATRLCQSIFQMALTAEFA